LYIIDSLVEEEGGSAARPARWEKEQVESGDQDHRQQKSGQDIAGIMHLQVNPGTADRQGYGQATAGTEYRRRRRQGAGGDQSQGEKKCGGLGMRPRPTTLFAE